MCADIIKSILINTHTHFSYRLLSLTLYAIYIKKKPSSPLQISRTPPIRVSANTSPSPAPPMAIYV